MYNIVSEKDYFDEIEKRIWGYNKPTALVFVNDNEESKRLLKDLESFKPAFPGTNAEIPIYVINIDECKRVAEEFHVSHEKHEHIDQVPIACVFADLGRLDERVKIVDDIIPCIHKYELALHSM